MFEPSAENFLMDYAEVCREHNCYVGTMKHYGSAPRVIMPAEDVEYAIEDHVDRLRGRNILHKRKVAR